MKSMKLSAGGNMHAEIKKSSETGARILQRILTVWIIFLSLALTTLPEVLAAGESETPDLSRRSIKIKKPFIQNAVRLQMPFIANEGQVENKQVLFFAQTFGGNAFITNAGDVVYSFPAAGPASPESKNPQADNVQSITEKFSGSSLPTPRGIDKSATRVNYFIGNDRSKWKTDIATYNTIEFGEVYEGIFLSLKAYGKNVEKVFTIQPGADPETIKVKIEGAASVQLKDSGELELTKGRDVLRLSRPIAYQEKAGLKSKIPVSYHYKDKDGCYGFRVADYDKSLPLIIDPYINFASRLGGEGDDWAHGIAVDAAGNAYITGKTGSSEFPVYSAYQGILKGEFDAFVAKISAGGNQLEYVTYLGGQGEDAGSDIVVTADGDAILVGETTSEDFPIEGVYAPLRPTYGGNGDAFVAVLNPSGAGLQYTSYIGGSGTDRGLAIARDINENIFIAGESTSNADFLPSPTAGAFQAGNNGNGDGFVVKFNPDATASYSTFLGGSAAERINDIAVDDEGNLYAAGQTASASDSFPATRIDFRNALSGQADAFVAKFNGDGSAVTYFRYIGGSANDGAAGIGLDRRGNAYLTGFTLSENFPATPDVLQPTAASAPDSEDAFVAKVSADGSSLVYATFLGGNAYDSGRTILVSPKGYAYVAGETLSASFPVTDGAFQADIASDGFRDAFLAKINLNGTSLLFSTYLGGSDEDWAEAVSGSESGSIFMTGSTASEDFPVSSVDYVLGPNGPIDVFAVRVDGIDRSVIYGTVRSAQEVPLANARVSAANDAAGFFTEVFTGSGGEYVLADLPAGCYNVQVLPPDGTTYVIGVQSGFYVEEGETVTGLDFYLAEGGLTLSGTIRRPDGAAVAGVQVIYENEALHIWRPVWTDGSGFYEFSNLPAGTAEIRVEAYDNLAPARRSINLFADTINFDFQLEPGACLAGRVVNTSGEGVSGVWVSYDNDALDIGRGSGTDSNGYFSICNLPEGIAQLQVQIDPVDSRGYCASTERAVYVQAGIDRAVKPFTLQPCALVEGRVITDTPADACGLEVFSDGVDFGANAEVEDGYYSLRLPPGTHKIYLDPNQEGPYTRAAYPVEVTIEATDIGSPTAVSAPDIIVMTAASADAGTVNGNIVKVSSGDPDPSGAFFIGLLPAGQLAAASPEALANTSGIQEKFMLPPPGYGEFALTPVPPGQYDAFCAVANSANGDIDTLTIIGSQPIAVNPGQPTALSNFEYLYSGSTRITGAILDQYGQPVLGATVLVIDSTGALAAFAKTDQNGGYSIYNLPAGTYTVQASHPLYTGRPAISITSPNDTSIPTEPLSLGYQAVSSPPGLDIVYNYYGAFTWTISTSSGPYTGLVFEVMVVDHDGVAGDGSSHVVEVTYPNGGPTKRLNFSSRIDGHSAYYELWDGEVPQPIVPSLYSGDYIFKVTDQNGDFTYVADNVQADPLAAPPDETTFSVALNPAQTIEATFEQACSYFENGLQEGCDTFTGGLGPGIWQGLPRWAWWENNTVRMAHVDSLGRGSTWLKLNEPVTDGSFSDLETRVRIDNTNSNEPFARIGGTYFNASGWDIFATVGIRQQEAFFTITRLRWDGNHYLTDDIVRDEVLGAVIQDNRYDIRLKWDGIETFTFMVRGVDDTVNYSREYQVAGKTGPPADAWQGIGIATWYWAGTTTPEFDWSPVDGATHYRVRIYGLNGSTIYRGYTTAPPFRLPPGILKPNAIYKYRIEALKDHQWFEWDNGGRSDPDLTLFATGDTEAQVPAIDLWGQGVYTWTDPDPFGANTWFYIKVHDAQGVPDNIASVRATVPDADSTVVNLYLDSTESANTGIYRGVFFGGMPPGTYRFTVTDKDGNVAEQAIEEDLTPNPIPAPAESSLVPQNAATVGDTQVHFTWQDVGAAFYQLDFYDKNFNFLYRARTEDSQYTLPQGLLEPSTLYKYRLTARREFFESNQDNGAVVPPFSEGNSNDFITTPTYGTSAPGIDPVSDGVALYMSPNPVNNQPVYWLEFYLKVDDPDGVPENIQKVEVTFPDGTTKRTLKYNVVTRWNDSTQTNEVVANYYDHLIYTDPLQIQDTRAPYGGVYTFSVYDFEGSPVATFTDELPDVTANYLDWAQNITPTDGSIVGSTTPAVVWRPVNQAGYYRVRIMSAWNYPTVLWSEALTDTSYTVRANELSPDTTYGLLVYAFRGAPGEEVDFYSSNSSRHVANPRFTTPGEDSDGDGLPDNWEYQYFGDLSRDQNSNSDTDALTDLQEFQNGTNPLNPDTDGDWVSDSDEVYSGTNPNDSNSFTATGTGAIRGTVRDASGSPIIGVPIQVEIYSGYYYDPCSMEYPDFSVSVDTASGNFILTGLWPDAYFIRTNNSGQSDYTNEWWAGTGSTADCKTAEHVIIAPDVASVNDFDLDIGGVISGVVTDPLGNPAADVSISLYDITSSLDYSSNYVWNVLIGSDQTQANGSFEFRGLSTGKYILQFDAGSDYASEFYNDAFISGSATPVAVTAGQTTSAIDLQLNYGGGISGVATDSLGNPLTGMQVTASNMSLTRSAVTQADGSYDIKGLSTGFYKVKVEDFSGTYLTEYYPNTHEENYAAAVSVVFSQATSGINFTLETSNSIIPLNFSVINVHEPDGSFSTDLQFEISGDFAGTLPDAIDAITITDPTGSNILKPDGTPYNIADFDYYEPWRIFSTQITGAAKLGEYQIAVTSGTLTGTAFDTQTEIKSLPIPEPGRMMPKDGAILTSKTPSFSWSPINYVGIPVYYRLVVLDLNDNTVFQSSWNLDALQYTISEGILTPGQSYKWRVQVSDRNNWLKVQNRAMSAWHEFTMAPVLNHSAVPAIDFQGWGVISWTMENGNYLEVWAKVIDHDGVASDGSSHSMTVEFPDGSQREVSFSQGDSGFSFYQYLGGALPQAGAYKLKVVDMDGNESETVVDDVNIAPLAPPDVSSITPSLNEIAGVSASAWFDNVYINGSLLDNFDGLNNLSDLDPAKWEHLDPGFAIESNQLKVFTNDASQNRYAYINFANPASVNSIKADVHVESSGSDHTRVRIGGYLFNNGVNDVWAEIAVWNNRVTYLVQEIIQNESLRYNTHAHGELASIASGQTVTVGVAWDGSQLTFEADGMQATYIHVGSVKPPSYQFAGMGLETSLGLEDTSPNFLWNPVDGANYYRVRIFDGSIGKTIWRGFTGNHTNYTLPPGILTPYGRYTYHIDARDAHDPLELDNMSRAPDNRSGFIQFNIRGGEAVKPLIELESHGIFTLNDASNGPRLSFLVKAHDAQGVPGNIDSVKVIHPDLSEEFLAYDGNNPDFKPTSTAAIYKLTSSRPIADGEYTFVVADKDGNSYAISEELTGNPIGYPAQGSLVPADGAVIGGTAVDFDWEDVDGAAFYYVEVYDYNFNLVHKFAATESRYHVPAGWLKEGAQYRYRITTRREFLDQNVDNMSVSPPDFYQMPTFTTTALIDSEPDGMPDEWEITHFGNLNHDGNGDSDNDGLIDRDEYLQATDPNNPDTDGDGIDDNNEVSNGTNPNDSASFMIAGTGAIRGTVRDAGGTPITGIQVQVEVISGDPCGGWSGVAAAQTDPTTGNYIVIGLAPGSYNLRTQNMNQSNYVNEWWGSPASSINCGGAGTISVASDAMSDGVDFNLDTGGSVSGQVVDNTGAGIAGLWMHAFSWACGGTWLGGIETDAQGNYTMQGLVPGQIYLQACPSCRSQSYVNEWWNGGSGAWDCNNAAPITVVSGQNTPRINFELESGGIISGTILSDAGGAINEIIQIQLWDYDTGEGRGGFPSLSDGTYAIYGLPAGTYRVMADASGSQQYAGEYFDNQFDWNSATRVTVTAGSETPNINFSLGQGGSISGLVQNETGEAIPNLWVYTHNYDNGTWFGGTNTDSNGAFTLRGLPPADYRVELDTWGTPYARELYNDTYNYNEASRVSVAAGTTTTGVNFSLALTGSISGTVVGTDGAPLPNLRIVANMFDGGWGGETRTNADGSYTIDQLPPTGYRVEVDPEGQNFIREYYDDSTDWSSAKRVVVTPGDDTPGIYFEVAQGFPIEGAVRYRRKPEQGTGILIEETLIEVWVQSFDGVLPNDIETVTVTDPDGVMVATFPDDPGFEWDPNKNEFAIKLAGRPKLGVYTFTVTSGDATATDTDYQYILREFPIPNKSALSPAEGAIIDSKTPTFSWPLIEYSTEDVPIFYRLEICEDNAGVPGNQIFATGRVKDMSFYTLPPNTLQPGQSYWWRERVSDDSDWVKVQNRVDSAWIPFTVASTLSAHAYKPAIDLDGWGTVTWTWQSGNTALENWIKVIDHDGVASNGSSHQVTLEFPDGSIHNVPFARPAGPTAGYYELYESIMPQPGSYIFRVTDPDNNQSEAVVDLLDADPLEPPNINTFTPNIKDQYITATFDNVRVNGQPYDDFDSYASIEDLDFSKWYAYYENVSIAGGKLVSSISNSIGRVNGILNFVNPDTISSIQADITVESISELDGIPYAQLKGIWYNDGKTEIGGAITVKGNRAYYSVFDDGKLNSQRTYSWDAALASGDLLTGISPGQTVTARISLSDRTLSFSVNGQPPVEYTIQGAMFPPVGGGYKQLRARINLTTDTTPTFTWGSVTNANRYRVRIYNYDSSYTIVNGSAGNEPNYTFPPGLLKPNAMYRYRIEAWDAPNPLNVDNVSKAPPSNNENYIFFTGSQEAVDPFIDLANSGVHTWNDPANGQYLAFWIEVHDAQGVPNDIKSVKVTHPSGAETVLEPWCSNPYSAATPTSCVYQENSSQPIEAGEYVFTVEDLEGHTYSVADELAPDVIGFPAVASLSPANSSVLNGTVVNFDWDDVPGRAFYALDIFDYDGNRVYQFFTTESEYNLPEGFLKEKTLYRWRVMTRREFFSEDVDNGSSSPDYWNKLTFTTTALDDTDEDGMPDEWESRYPGLNPGVDDATGDLDSDGLNNKEEYDNATDPTNPDSDGDGYSDGLEISQGTNPKNSGDFSGIPNSERNALIALYNSTNGDEWSNSSGWKEPPLAADGFALPGTECDWSGITCDASQDHVVGIDLTANHLVGPLPPELGNLADLRNLSVFDNQVSGAIPEEIGGLSNLTGLDLCRNEMTGSIPPELGNLTALGFFHLCHNNFTGSIPPEIGSLTNLFQISLEGNQLSGNIPAEIGNLNNLAYLNLGSNRLEGTIPSEIGNMDSLERLYLGGNQLSGFIPPEMGNLSNLEVVGLAGNQLWGSVPTELMSLTNLINNESDFRWNYLYTNNDALREFLNTKQIDGDWESTQGAPIEVSVQNVRNSDGSFVTYIDVIINDFRGTLPGSIDSIVVRGPGGDVVTQYPDDSGWIYYPQWHDFVISLDESPATGIYTFEIRSGLETRTGQDYQYTLRSFPVPDDTSFSPKADATITSKTPSFTWDPVDFNEDIPVYYRLSIYEDVAGDFGYRVFQSGIKHNMNYFTVPNGVLVPGEKYLWKIDVMDSDNYTRAQNRSRSALMPITIADDLAPHSYKPTIDLEGWGSTTYTWETGGTGHENWLKVIDHDGVASDGSSHTVTVEYPDGSIHTTSFVAPAAPNAGYYEFFDSEPSGSGPYTFRVTDLDGNESAPVIDDVTADPLAPPNEESFSPNVKDEFITATFDNVYVNGAPYEDFDTYTNIADLDFSKWYSNFNNVSISDGKLFANAANSIGRGNANLNFTNPDAIYSIRADITVNSISDDEGPPRASIKGTFYNNGVTEIGAEIRVKGNRVFYIVGDDGKIDGSGTYSWGNALASGELMTGIAPGQTITAEISFIGNQFTFSADGNIVAYPAAGPVAYPVFPPLSGYKQLRCRIDLSTDSTPTFNWDAVANANRYRVRIYNFDNSKVIANGYTGNEPTFTFPPGVLKPNSYYRYRIEAWDAPNPLDVDNVSKTPPSNNNNYIFYTGSAEAVEPSIDFHSHGVFTWTDPVAGTKLNFAVIIHDAQGVPENIKSVKVVFPSGAEEILDYYSSSYHTKTATSGSYRKLSDKAVEGGTYTFIVEDKDNHSSQVTEDLDVNPIGYPAQSSLLPLNGVNIGGTGVDFAWDKVEGATNYWLEIFDYEYNRLYTFYFSQPEPGVDTIQYSLPEGFLKNGQIYRWRVQVRREFVSDNCDNGSSMPDSWNMFTFTTTPVVDEDGDGMPDEWESKYDVNDPSDDQDGDGLTNKEEYDNATDPTNPDSDGDGYNDGLEISQSTNPKNSDDFSGIPKSERSALIALYNSTNGGGWSDNSGWKEPPLAADGFALPGTECSWFGIACDASEDHVISINLSYNQLTGGIPAELANLVSLQVLSLSGNQLTGSIPAEIGNLNNLRYLYLYDNQLTGPIPAELGSLTNLQWLWANNNQLEGTIPVEIGNLENLQYLNVSSNQMTGSIPVQISNLIELQRLYLYDNQLTGNIPAEIGNLNKLLALSLANNQLAGSIPDQIGNLTLLQDLDLSRNQLTGAIPAEIGNLNKLQYLWIDTNQLTGPIPAGFGNLTDLQYLKLNENHLTGSIPAGFGNLTKLRYLALNSNNLTGSIPDNLKNLDQLEPLFSDLRWNALYTDDEELRNLLNAAQSGGDWESTQTVAPTNITIGAKTDTSVELSWTAIPYTGDTGGYEVGYSTEPTGPYTVFETTADKTITSSTVTGLNPETTYYFRLRTVTTPNSNNQNTVYSNYTNGGLHVMHARWEGLYPDVQQSIIHLDNLSGGWSTPELVIKTAVNDLEDLDADVDRNGNWHAVYIEDPCSTGTGQSCLRYASAGTVPVTIAEGSVSTPTIAIDTNGGMHVMYSVWDNYPNMQVMYMNNLASSWSTPVSVIETVTDDFEDLSADVDRNGNWHAVYIEDPCSTGTGLSCLRYASAGSAPVTIADDIVSTPAISIDTSGGLHVMYSLWGAYPNMQVMYINNLAGSWSPAVSVMETVTGTRSILKTPAAPVPVRVV